MRRIKIILAGAAAGLVLLAFWSWQGPARAIARSDSPSPAPHEPIWRTCLRDIVSEPDPTERAVDLGRLAEALPGAELQAAIDALQPEAESSPGARLRLLLLRRWADQDPAAAATWVARLPDDYNQIAAWSSVGYGLAQKNPADAIALAVQQPSSQAREALLQYAVQQWARLDGNSAVAWAGRLPDLKLRDEFLSIIAVEWAVQDPARAAAFAASALTAGRPRDEALLQIAATWTRAAPEQAAGWISRLPGSEGEVRDFAIGQLTATWARKDLVKAAEWIIQLPMDGSRDAASSAYAPILAVTDPDLATQWLEEIQDSAVRAAARERLRNMQSLISSLPKPPQ
jgi:hypothetical protein